MASITLYADNFSNTDFSVTGNGRHPGFSHKNDTDIIQGATGVRFTEMVQVSDDVFLPQHLVLMDPLGEKSIDIAFQMHPAERLGGPLGLSVNAGSRDGLKVIVDRRTLKAPAYSAYDVHITIR